MEIEEVKFTLVNYYARIFETQKLKVEREASDRARRREPVNRLKRTRARAELSRC